MQPKIYHASEHDIDPSFIDSEAIYVLQTLKEAGFLAYLVGGSVRDLLLKKTPKDFDISTSARPEQIKQVFQRSCLLIGRRFRLAHIRFGHKIIEVSTFRSGDNQGDLILHDNEWGTPEEDVLRRDFTMNGLYYDPSTHMIIDYVGGWEDIHKNLLKTIGDPSIRFKQDPVRMIRLLKFHARFNFKIDPEALKALLYNRLEIVKSSPARILEECLRMLESGYSAPFIRLIKDSSLLELLFPRLNFFLDGEHGEEVFQYLEAADTLILKSKNALPDRSVLLTCLLYPILEREIRLNFAEANVHPQIGQIMMLSSAIVKALFVSAFSHFPRRLSTEVNFILSTQYRLTPLNKKRHHNTKLIHTKEFGLALKFLKIRAMKDPSLLEEYERWLHLQRQVNDHRGHHRHTHSKHKHPGNHV